MDSQHPSLPEDSALSGDGAPAPYKITGFNVMIQDITPSFIEDPAWKPVWMPSLLTQSQVEAFNRALELMVEPGPDFLGPQDVHGVETEFVKITDETLESARRELKGKGKAVETKDPEIPDEVGQSSRHKLKGKER
jgi:hypothetical protein